jgi:hypothetical protein
MQVERSHFEDMEAIKQSSLEEKVDLGFSFDTISESTNFADL